MPALWPHQLSGGKKINRSLQKHRRVIACAPCGAGKTVMMVSDAQEQLAAGNPVMFMAPRIEIVGQICKKLDEWLPIGYSLITARTREGNSGGIYSQVHVASVDTLVSRAVRRGNLILPTVKRVYADEAHLYITSYRTALLDLFPKAEIIGYSATPARPNGKALALAFEDLIEITTPGALIESGHLVKPNYMAPTQIDRAKIKKVGDDFDDESAGEAVLPIVGDIVEHWMANASDRHTACFMPGIKHSLYMRNQFVEAGVSCEHVDSKMDHKEREEVMGRFARGETQILCNVGLLEYGIDIPSINCIIDAAATMSVVKYIQRGGRGMRTAPSKSDLLYLDHAGNVHEHGYLEDDRYWTLKGLESRKKPRAKKRAATSEPPKTLTCPECKTVFKGSLTCPCGYHFEALAREFRVIDGKLEPLTTKDAEDNPFMRVRFYCELLQYQATKNYKAAIPEGDSYRPGWAEHTYKERFKKFPPPRWLTFAPLPPSTETLRYIRYCFIKRAKRNEAAARRRA